MRILVTGATGFIGSHLVEHLLEKGHTVKALVRPSSDCTHLHELGISTVVGDISKTDTLIAAVDGVGAVFHLASILKAPWRPTFFSVNIEGSRHISAACAAQPKPPTLIVVSSMAAAGPSPIDAPRHERIPTSPISIYGRVKHAAECAVLDFSSQVPISIVRPPMVFGERDTSLLKLFRLVQSGHHILPTRQPARLSLIHATDLAHALLSIATHGERAVPDDPASGVYHLADPITLSTAELGTAVAAAMDLPPPRIWRLPRVFTFLAAWISGTIARLRDRPTVLNLDKYREITAGSWTTDPSKAINDLGFTVQPLDERLRQTRLWYEAQGWLSPPVEIS
jgi:dihydroflavonol-4-reductase